MLIKQNTVVTFYFVINPGDAVNPPNYQVFKNGAGGVPGVGAIGVFAPSGSGTIYAVNLTAADTDTLGQLFIVVNQAGVNWGVELDIQVVPDVPGASVQEVLGDVGGDVGGDLVGNVVGNLLGTIAVATRLAIADDVWTIVDEIESGLNPRDALRAIFAVLCGKSSASAFAAAFRNFGDTKTRVQVTFVPGGSRTLVTFDFS